MSVVGQVASGVVDPYWDGLWAGGSHVSWVSVGLAQRQEAARLGRLPDRWRMDADVALEFLLSAGVRDKFLRVLAGVFQWRTVTVEQLARLTGVGEVASVRSRLAGALFASGLVDFGFMTTGLLGARRGFDPSFTVFRLARTRVFVRDVAPTLSTAEWLAVTGGLEWSTSRVADRHNVLSVEVGLRAAEFLPLGGVLGERFASHSHLFGLPGQACGDLVLVRDDGVRVVCEITASVNEKFKEKVRVWARVLESNRWVDSGVVVVFVDASDPERANLGSNVGSQIRSAVASAVRAFPGTVSDRVAERMGVVSWQDWFPGSGQVSDGFSGLRVERATGGPDRVWESVELLDVFALSSPGGWVGDVVGRVGLLAGVPHQFVAGAVGESASVVRAGVQAFGVSAGLRPAVPAGRRVPVSKVGQARGAVAGAGVPHRLVWPRVS